MTADELNQLAEALLGNPDVYVTHVVFTVETEDGITDHELHSNGDREKPFFVDCATVPDENAPSFGTIAEAIASV